MMFRNAIAVQNIGSTQVGHIPRQTAAKLAPLIDAGLITVEGTMNEGNCKFRIVKSPTVLDGVCSAGLQLFLVCVSTRQMYVIHD
jgi:hypothetical protein